MVFIIFLRKGSVKHGIYFEGSAREKRLRNAGLDSVAKCDTSVGSKSCKCEFNGHISLC